jgi:hypothetical protein
VVFSKGKRELFIRAEFYHAEKKATAASPAADSNHSGFSIFAEFFCSARTLLYDARVCLLKLGWVDLGGEPGGRLEMGEDSQYLAEGGTQRTRLIGFARICPRLRRQRRLAFDLRRDWSRRVRVVFNYRKGSGSSSRHLASRRDTACRVV